MLGMFAVRIEELAAAMVDITVNGGNEPVVNNDAIVRRGREVLRTQK